MNKILIIDDLHPAFAEKAKALGFEVDDKPQITRTETLAVIKDYVGIAVRTKFRIDKEIFDESINLDSVRIKTVANWVSEGFSAYARALVIGNDILVPQKQDLKGLPDIHEDQELFNHELTHIWQHQNGGTNYLTEALYAQGLGDGYDIHKGLVEDKKFAELNPEQQGEMVKMIYQRKNLSRQQRASDFFPSDILTDSQIEEALYSIRNGLGAP